MRQLACPIQFSNSVTDAHSTTGGTVGAECSRVLKDLLDMSDTDIALLRENGTLMREEDAAIS